VGRLGGGDERSLGLSDFLLFAVTLDWQRNSASNDAHFFQSIFSILEHLAKRE